MAKFIKLTRINEATKEEYKAIVNSDNIVSIHVEGGYTNIALINKANSFVVKESIEGIYSMLSE